MPQLTKVLATAVFLFSSATAAHAAPQILGVVATAQPLKLHCADGHCQAEVPTLCLEHQRKAPIGGEVYKPTDLSVFSVLARNAAGQTVQVPLRDAVFRAVRRYTASRVVLSTAGMRARGLTPVALTVKAGTILIPAPVPGDRSPISRAEVERVKDVLWPMAEHVIDKRRLKLDTIGLVNRLLNQTPVAGPMTKAARNDLWHNTFGTPPRAAEGGAAGLAAGALGACQRSIAKGLTFTLRECLETRVDDLLTDIDVEYWLDVKHVLAGREASRGMTDDGA